MEIRVITPKKKTTKTFSMCLHFFCEKAYSYQNNFITLH